jgi:hypothetical protein
MLITVADTEREVFVAAPIETAAKNGVSKRGSHDDLELCRRLDWRMLFAQPSLRRVAYVGKAHGTLVEALKRFSESLTVFESSEESFAASQSNKAFDLLVLHMPAVRDVEMMRLLLKPGGSLYVELERPQRSIEKFYHFHRKDAGPKTEDYVAVLQRSGFSEIDTYWHRPNFETCLEIIPLDDRTALKHVFSRSSAGLKNRMKFMAGRMVMRAGLLARNAPCVSIVARKSAAEEDER